MPQDLPDNYIPRYAPGSDMDSIRRNDDFNDSNGGLFKKLKIAIILIILISVFYPATTAPDIDMVRTDNSITDNQITYEITMQNNTIKTYFNTTVTIKYIASDGTISQYSQVANEMVVLPFQTKTYTKTMTVPTTPGGFKLEINAPNYSIGSIRII